jgi:hypothetical protein
MPEDLKTFKAVFVELVAPECRLVTTTFHIEDEADAIEVAEDMALLEGTELIYLSKS